MSEIASPRAMETYLWPVPVKETMTSSAHLPNRAISPRIIPKASESFNQLLTNFTQRPHNIPSNFKIIGIE